MNILIFSDTHLDTTFETKRYLFLKNLIQQADQVIINGDFWEGWLITFSQFLDSPWNQLFPLLKVKKTVYLYGNHDNKALCDDRISLFSDTQTYQYRLKSNGKIYIFEHGNRFNFSYKKFAYIKTIKSIMQTSFFVKSTRLAEGIFIKNGGKNFLSNRGGLMNKEIKRQIKTEFTHNEIVICGHTHSAEIDLNNRFVNSGYIRHGVAQYITLNNTTKLITTKY